MRENLSPSTCYYPPSFIKIKLQVFFLLSQNDRHEKKKRSKSFATHHTINAQTRRWKKNIFFSCRKVVKLSSRYLVLVRGRILGFFKKNNTLCNKFPWNFFWRIKTKCEVNFKRNKKLLMDFLAALKQFFWFILLELKSD